MKPAPFAYWRPETVDEACWALAEAGADAKVLAGGQSLLPMMNMRLARPGVVVDINALSTLEAISRPDASTLQTGALVRQRALERYAAADPALQLFRHALAYVGHPQTRNRGTVGGSIAHADPAAELPVLLTALGGRITLLSRQGTRVVSAEAFFQAPFVTAVETGELLTQVEWFLPPPGSAMVFREFARRRGDFALVAVAAVLRLDQDQRVTAMRLGLGGVDGVPRAVPAATSLVGLPLDSSIIADFAAEVARSLDPPADLHAPAEFRRELARVLVARVLEDARRQVGHVAGERGEG